jgi:hypothetical protein
MTEAYVRSIEAQILGRVFTYDDAIHFVLGTDAETGMARCSRRTPDGPGITYLPMTEVRRLVYDADRLYYLKRVEEAKGNLDKAKKLLVQIGHAVDPSLDKVTTEVVLVIEDLTLALDNSPGKVSDIFAKLGERINMMLLKGELVLAGATFKNQF